MTYLLTRRSILVIVLGAFVALCPWGEVWAASAKELKQAGVAGERPDGYLGLVDKNASASVKKNIEDINRKRREKYQSLADKNGTQRAVIEKLSGTKLIKQTPKGQYIMSGGKWVRK